jgi:hypothetical protein
MLRKKHHHFMAAESLDACNIDIHSCMYIYIYIPMLDGSDLLCIYVCTCIPIEYIHIIYKYIPI